MQKDKENDEAELWTSDDLRRVIKQLRKDLGARIPTNILRPVAIWLLENVTSTSSESSDEESESSSESSMKGIKAAVRKQQNQMEVREYTPKQRRTEESPQGLQREDAFIIEKKE
jgi:hypothetical protein